MASLEGVLANIPGLAGYLAQNQINQQTGAQGLQTVGSLVQLQAALRKQQEDQALKATLAQSGGDLEKALAASIQSGNITAAHALAPLVESQRKARLPEKGQPIGAGGLLQPSGEIVPPQERTGEKKPLIQMLPISDTHEQPHISQDNGKTFVPIPGSKPRPIFAPKEAQTPENIDTTARAIANYQIPPLSSFAMSRPGGRDVMAKVVEINPQYDAKNFVTAQRTRNSFAVGVEGRTVRSFNVAIDHLDTLNEAASALQNNDIKRFNQLAQRTAEETGSPIPTNFDAIKGIVAKEIVKSVVGNATAGGVTERQDLEKELSRASSPDQLKGMISRYQTLMAGQLKGLKQQYEAGLGGSNFEEKFLLPRSREVFSRMQQGGGNPTTPKVRIKLDAQGNIIQ